MRLSTQDVDDAQCEAFFDALAKAKRPLIYAGGGVIAGEAAATLRAFAQQFGLPVTTTLMGIGAFDTTEPLGPAHARHAWHGVCELRGGRL